MKVTIITDGVRLEGKTLEKGATVEIPDKLACTWISHGLAEAEKPKPVETATAKPITEKATTRKRRSI
jgi:hypothetical protein